MQSNAHIIKLSPGESTYQIDSSIGSLTKFHQKIQVTTSSIEAIIWDTYKNYLFAALFIIVVGWALWFTVGRKYYFLKTQLNNIGEIARTSGNAIELQETELKSRLKSIIQSHGYLRKPLMAVVDSISFSESLELLNIITANINQEKPKTAHSTSVSITEISKIIESSPLLQRVVNVVTVCEEDLSVSQSLEPFAYFMNRAAEIENQQLTIEIKASSSYVKIFIAVAENTPELTLIRNVILVPYYQGNITKNETILHIERSKEGEDINDLLFDDKQPLYKQIGSKRKNVLVIGSHLEFNSQVKRDWLTKHLLSEVKNTRIKIVENFKDILKLSATYKISKYVHISIHSTDFSILKTIRKNLPNCENSIITVTSTDKTDEAYANGAKIVVSKDTSPSNIKSIIANNTDISDSGSSEALAKLHHGINSFIQSQRKAGASKAGLFPRSFEKFSLMVGVNFSNQEINEIESIVEEKVSKYCTLYRIRKFAEWIKEHPETRINSEKLIFGFGEKSRTFDIFKSEFGMTPEKYRQYQRSILEKSSK